MYKNSSIKKYVLRTVASLLLVFIAMVAVAQDNPGDPGDDPGLIPIDGGLSFLLAAGIGYGAKKAYDFRKGMKRKVQE